MEFAKDLLRFSDGRRVTTKDLWELRRAEILKILAENAYGYLPDDPVTCHMDIKNSIAKCCSGHGVLHEVEFVMTSDKGDCAVPGHFFMPTSEGLHPLILLLNFRPDAYDRYYPAEEIIDNGFALISVCYHDINQDLQPDISLGLGSILTPPDPLFGYGKISLWAFAASRILDSLADVPGVDLSNAAIAGHSRLGKTALWCGANDTRFKFVLSNCSGCMGDALNQFKHEGAETIRDIQEKFPYWFCNNFFKYRSEEELPYDQHWLMACISPRFVCTAAAEKNEWADPLSQRLCCVGASDAWKFYGLAGFVGKEGQPAVNTADLEGHIGHSYRDGIHFLGRPDWIKYMDFIKRHLN
ncbi:MAG: hypothetical protein K5756_06525 [Clostridiales bacterium]|nr:hypothetical protein [Clostridiales bacterium]